MSWKKIASSTHNKIKEGSFLSITNDYDESCQNVDLIEPIIYDKPYGMKAHLIMPQTDLGEEIPVVEDSMVVFGKNGSYMRGIYVDEEHGVTNEFHGDLNCPAIVGSSEFALGVFVPFEPDSEHGYISYRNAYLACQTIMDFALGNGTTVIDRNLLEKLSRNDNDNFEYPFEEDDF